ncbi:MAG: hypothetical protein ILP19_05595, partial [Oscillospiraceae bacterium]|nr:hypothetical protein [Oscillospiraceae bacterium]
LIPSLEKKKRDITRWVILGGMCAAAVICGIIMIPGNNADELGQTSETGIVGTTEQTTAEIPAAGSETSTGVKNTVYNHSISNGTVTMSPGTGKAVVLSKAIYPDMPEYPVIDESVEHTTEEWQEYDQKCDDWWDSLRKLREQPEGYDDGFDAFFEKSAPVFLADAGNENRLYSPLGLYMALAMTAETTGGQTRQQILDALAQSDIDTLRSHARSVWLSNYLDDGSSKSILANSIWTNELKSYNEDTVNNVSENYYASVFSGQPTDEGYNRMFRDWINESTDDLLTESIADHTISPDMVMTLASTVNYSGSWANKFDKSLTGEGIFHSPGGDISCDFMKDQVDTVFKQGEKFRAVVLDINNNGSVRLLLPEDGVSAGELLSDSEAMEYMMNNFVREDSTEAIADISVPKFDISSETDLIGGMEKMGITDVFDADKADFTPLCNGSISVTKAEQAARVIIDEDGCRAASYTMIEATEGELSSGRVSMVFDKPFVFEIVGEKGLPLFVGIVKVPV